VLVQSSTVSRKAANSAVAMPGKGSVAGYSDELTAKQRTEMSWLMIQQADA
jgi:hypothetical protein